MTDRQSPARGRAPSWRRDLLFVGTIAIVCLAIAIVDALSVFHDRAESGDPIPFWEPLVWETTSAMVLVLLAPLVQVFTRRFRPLDTPWVRLILAHLAFSVAFSLMHVATMGVLRWAVYAAVGGEYAAFGPLRDFPYEFRKDLLAYFGMVAIYTVWLRLPERPEDPGSDTAAIEVRDGARRQFVPLSEVAWIEAAGNYVQLHRGATPILHRAPLSALERQLQTAGFVRIHRSRLVRRGAVAEVESKPSGDYVVRLADGRELAGSRRYRRPLLEP